MGKNEKEEEVRKELRYLSGERIEPQIFDRIVKVNGEYKVEHRTYTMVYDNVLHRWVNAHDEKIEYRPLSTWKPPITQDLPFTVHFRRHAWDSNLKPISAVFEQKMRLKATLPDEFFCYFDGRIIRTFLDSGISDPISVRDERIQKIGNERKLSDAEVQKLIKNNVPIYDERPDGLVLNL